MDPQFRGAMSAQEDSKVVVVGRARGISLLVPLAWT